jgi:hypothetical protein
MVIINVHKSIPIIMVFGIFDIEVSVRDLCLTDKHQVFTSLVRLRQSNADVKLLRLRCLKKWYTDFCVW